jgi:hypothetical protein
MGLLEAVRRYVHEALGCLDQEDDSQGTPPVDTEGIDERCRQ